jgi:hypothetical protein
MPASNTPDRRKASWLALALLVLVACVGVDGFARASDEAIHVTRIEPHLGEGIWQIDADFQTELDERAVQALTHGVPLSLMLEVRLSPAPRWYWPWPEPIAEAEETFLIHQHALSGQFIVQRVNSGQRFIYRDVREALSGIGTVRNLSLVEAGALEAGVSYRGSVRLSLDIEELPAPMRPLAWLSWGRRFTSGWHHWAFVT